MWHATNIDNTRYRVSLVPYISGVELDTSAINFISACPEMTRSNILLVAWKCILVTNTSDVPLHATVRLFGASLLDKSALMHKDIRTLNNR